MIRAVLALLLLAGLDRTHLVGAAQPAGRYDVTLTGGGTSQELELWTLSEGRVSPGDQSAELPRAVGSVQKAWVVKAWALRHADAKEPLPRITCGSRSHCWLASGHGNVDLRAATARSCNAYFRSLAAEVPRALLAATFEEAGFEVSSPPDEEAAIGLDPQGPRIAPRTLLLAYSSLVRVPWPVRDDARREWLAGMRDATASGTAGLLPFRGLLAKTGTVPAREGRGLVTSGWAIVLDPTGFSGWLAFLPRGTGAEAAAALGRRLSGRLAGVPKDTRTGSHRAASLARVPAPEEGEVRVRLLAALGPAQVVARNAGEVPIRFFRRQDAGWLGPGEFFSLRGGDQLAAGLWELSVAPHGLVRWVRGSLEATGEAGEGARVRLRLLCTSRDYVEGVLRGELPVASARAVELAAAILRHLAEGPQHGTDDVCDLSHCGRFVGFGPPVAWPSPVRAVTTGRPELTPRLDDGSWNEARRLAAEPGPSTWTSHCGGEPLSAHAVWGSGSGIPLPCARHTTRTAEWTRLLRDDQVSAACGSRVRELESVEREGVLVTHAVTDAGEKYYLYDELHRLIAVRAGWDALPSPPDGYVRVAGGWSAHGHGKGHRVGLCLGE